MSTPKEKAPKDKQLVAFYIKPAQNMTLEELKFKSKLSGEYRDKSDFVREAIEDLIKKYRKKNIL